MLCVIELGMSDLRVLQGKIIAKSTGRWRRHEKSVEELEEVREREKAKVIETILYY